MRRTQSYQDGLIILVMIIVVAACLYWLWELTL
jgi:flagellin-like protein